jgi:hypothetical protein
MYETRAKILYWAPKTLKDFLKLSEREFGKQDKEIEKMFGVSVEEISYVPTSLKIKGFFKAILENPFYSILALGLNFYLRRPQKAKVSKKSFWETTKSSKGAIS